MRKFIVLIILSLAGCAYKGPANHTPVSKQIVQKQENKEEYEITIIDPNFDRWFLAHAKPVEFYQEGYYRTKNISYVSAWNAKVSQRGLYGSRNYPFEEMINYNPSEDYGIDVNYRLFWYFKYIEDVYGRRYNFHG